MEKPCGICDALDTIRAGGHPRLVAELETGYVVLGDDQSRRGWTLLMCKRHATELHELDGPFKTQFLADLALTAEAVWRAFSPVKLNYELLGNAEPHLHWHVFPRFADDPDPAAPIWLRDPPLPAPPPAEVEAMRAALVAAFDQLRK